MRIGDIIVQKSGKFGCGIVEMISHGCVICYWEVGSVDGEPFPELRAVHDRITSIDFNRSHFFESVSKGQALANKIVVMKYKPLRKGK